MPEPQITRSELIVVATIGENAYKDLLFTDSSGKEYKISNKRVPYFKNVILAGGEIKLNYTKNSFGKEYIWNAEQTGKHEAPLVTVAKKLGAVPDNSLESVQPTPQTSKAPINTYIPSGAEIGMTVKEIGDLIRAKLLTEVFGENAKKVLDWYKLRMKTTMGIN